MSRVDGFSEGGGFGEGDTFEGLRGALELGCGRGGRVPVQRLGFGQDDAQGPLVKLVPRMNPEVADRLPVGAEDCHVDKVGPEET